jgi:hypothetical protein
MKKSVTKPTKAMLKRVEEIKEELLESPIFKQMQIAVKQHNAQVELIQKQLAPTLEQITKIQKQFESLPERTSLFSEHNTIVYQRPVEYLILDKLKELNKKNASQKIEQSNFVVTYDSQDGLLSRNVDGTVFPYNLNNSGKRKQLFDLLLRKNGYIKTEALRDKLDCSTNEAVYKIIQAVNRNATIKLKLTKVTLIKNRDGLGYRLNPKVIIENQ